MNVVSAPRNSSSFSSYGKSHFDEDADEEKDEDRPLDRARIGGGGGFRLSALYRPARPRPLSAARDFTLPPPLARGSDAVLLPEQSRHRQPPGLGGIRV